MNCNNCNGPIYDGDISCRNCGAPVNNIGLNAQSLGTPIAGPVPQQNVLSQANTEAVVAPVESPAIEPIANIDSLDELTAVPVSAPLTVAPAAADVLSQSVESLNVTPTLPSVEPQTIPNPLNVLPGMQPNNVMPAPSNVLVQQPGVPNNQMPSSPKKSSKNTVLILIILILVIAIGVAVYFVFFNDSSTSNTKTPSNTVNNTTSNTTNNSVIEDNENDDEDIKEDDEEEDNAPEISTNWQDYEVEFEGETISLPLSYEEFSSITSFHMSDSYIEERLGNNRYTVVNLYADDKLSAYVDVYNDTGKEISFAESLVTRVSQTSYHVNTNKVKKFVFPGGLYAGLEMTEEELYDILGEADDVDVYESDNYSSYTYTYSEEQTDYATSNFYKIKIVNGEINELELDNLYYK